MTARHLEILVEELSMEAFLGALLPRVLGSDHTFAVHPFQGKPDLLGKLEARLRGYAAWLPDDWRIVVLVDRDDDDCRALKKHLEWAAAAAGLRTRSRSGARSWHLVNRIAIEELEAWYFGDWEAVVGAYPGVPVSVPKRKGLRDPDAIAGGTWEALERIMRKHGYFKTGLRKLEVAQAVGARIEPERCRSRSFLRFHEALAEATV